MSIVTHRADCSSRLRKIALQFAYPVCLFLFARVWSAAFASLSLIWLPLPITSLRLYYGMAPLDNTTWGWLVAPWQRWDGIWYTAIAARGYSPDDMSTAFFPLYPLLIRSTSTVLPISGVAAGLMVSSLAALGAFVLFYQLVCEDYGDQTARRALLYLAVFPTAFFLFAAYPESLFLFFALGAWWCARQKYWEYAGVLGGLAALTRPQGALLVLPLAIMFQLQYKRGEVSLWRIVSLVEVIGAAPIFFLYLFQVDQSPAAWFEIQGRWRQFALPWEPLWNSALAIFTRGDVAIAFLNALDLGLTVLFVGLLVWSACRRQLAESLYLSILIFPPLFTIARFDPNLPLASISRFLVVAFPGFALLGSIRFREPWLMLVVGFSFLVQNILLVVFTHWIFAG